MKLQPVLLISVFLASFFVSGSALALECKDPQTQTDMNLCAAADLENETKKINKTYADYVKTKLNPSQKKQFKEVQLAWIKFKDLACKFEAASVEGGSIHPMILSGCLAEKTRQRNKEIEALSNCQEGNMSCPVP